MNLSPENSDPLIHHDLDDSEIGIGGVAVALLIISIWAIGLGFLWTSVKIDRLPLWCTLLAVLWQAFIYTGLFITAHDAMHGAIAPKHPRLNRAIGQFTLLAYGLFSYERLLTAHRQHHHHPASDLDPDFHDGSSTNALAWYLYFMKRYWSWPRFLAQVTVFHILHLICGIPEANLILFWIVPALMSSMQLFYFGTFLPHSEPQGGYKDKFRTQSSYRPLWLSFLTCYHFGYHHEHHRFPNLAWWQLPKAVRS
jgi:beta-carotene/zeaxanthin 4-ketolase